MKNRINEIKNKLDKLQHVSGLTNGMDFTNTVVFNPCLSLDAITDFEKRYSIVLPDDYKAFLLYIGNGGFGPEQGLRSLEDSAIDFKLIGKPDIALDRQFPYAESWNEKWISTFDWDEDYPDSDLVDDYMATSHIDGCLQICHLGHGNTCLLVVNGESYGSVWLDGRADYGGLRPIVSNGVPVSFLEWYLSWLDSLYESKG